jgi:hypothetical protein
VVPRAVVAAIVTAGQVLEGPAITAAAAPGWISWADLGSGIHIARTLSV